MRLTMLLCLIFLMGCTRLPNTDEPSLVDVFSVMEIPNNQLLIHYRDDAVDRTEMIDTRNHNAVLIHIIEGDTSWSILIKSDWIYDTRTMQKEPNAYDNANSSELNQVIKAYTEHYDAVIHEANALTALVLRLHEPTFHRTGNGFMLRGLDTTHSTAMDENAMVEVYYQDNTLQAVGYRLEKDFPSTKNQSNFIEGTHITYGETLEVEFPPLSEFDGVNE